jgi:hypothetical protein
MAVNNKSLQKAVSGRRYFATKKYPTFGRGLYNAENPPKTVTQSPFYWWFKFLQLNEDYKNAFNKKKSTVSKQFVSDFGNVFDADFKTWWQSHVDLFAEPKTNYNINVANSVNEIAPFNDKEVINLVVPLNWTNVGIKRRFAQIIDKLVPKTLRTVKVNTSEAKYRLGRKWSVVAMKSAYDIYVIKKANDLAVENGEKKLAWADIAIKANLARAKGMTIGKRTFDNGIDRRTLTILAKRHHDRALEYIKDSATESFPK